MSRGEVHSDRIDKLIHKIKLLGYKYYRGDKQVLVESIRNGEVWKTLYICEDSNKIEDDIKVKLSGNVMITGNGKLDRFGLNSYNHGPYYSSVLITKLIIDIDTGSNFDCTNAFKGMKMLKDIKFIRFDTSGSNDMHCMFKDCIELEELDLSIFDTTQVGDMSNMFEGCKSLKKLNISNFNTKNLRDMSKMFYIPFTFRVYNVSKFFLFVEMTETMLLTVLTDL